VRCNICDGEDFQDFNGRKNILCSRCGSYERTRLIMLHLQKHGIQKDMHVLHFAPEAGLSRFLASSVERYVAADFDVARYSNIKDVSFVDLTKPETYERLGKFDLILHSHVIEHIPFNYAALLLRLHRMLRPGGVHGFSIPIYGPHYSEHWGPMTNEEATTRFGQFDHIRRFSPFDLDRTIGALFRLPDPDLVAQFGADALREYNIPESSWRGWDGHSVFWLRSEDCHFLN